jgi:hypothetical protein
LYQLRVYEASLLVSHPNLRTPINSNRQVVRRLGANVAQNVVNFRPPFLDEPRDWEQNNQLIDGHRYGTVSLRRQFSASSA